MTERQALPAPYYTHPFGRELYTDEQMHAYGDACRMSGVHSVHCANRSNRARCTGTAGSRGRLRRIPAREDGRVPAGLWGLTYVEPAFCRRIRLVAHGWPVTLAQCAVLRLPLGEPMMMPTMSLRFVERETTTNTTAAGELLPEGVVRTIKVRVLQQQWVSVVDPSSEWRDVPLVTA